MPHVVSSFKIMDGPSHVTLHTYIQGDGISGELTNYVLLDPATQVTPNMPRMQDFIIKQIWYELQGFGVRLLFNATKPWPAWNIAPGASLHHDWRFFGGIRDHSDSDNFGLDSDGKLLISTTGLATTTNCGTFVLHLEKRDRPNPQPD